MRALSALLLILLAGSTMGLNCAPFPEPDENTEPTIRIVWPQLAPTGEPVLFDGSQTLDSEGPIIRYEMTFGDGTELRTSDDGVFEHTYSDPGSYSFLFTATDVDGARGELTGTVVLADVVDDPMCTCALPCLGDGRCTTSGCVLAASSSGDGDAGPSDDMEVDGELACGGGNSD